LFSQRLFRFLVHFNFVFVTVDHIQ
jgi:hypothetical protein